MTDNHTHRGDDVHSVEMAMRDYDEGVMGWQPIETAPAAVTLLLFVDPYILTGVRFRNAWMNRGEHIAPTHWMPLPAAPTEGEL